MRQVKLLNVAIDNLSRLEFLEKCKSGIVFTPNVDHLMKLQDDLIFILLITERLTSFFNIKILFLFFIFFV